MITKDPHEDPKKVVGQEPDGYFDADDAEDTNLDLSFLDDDKENGKDRE
jgi:hypothetical protein